MSPIKVELCASCEENCWFRVEIEEIEGDTTVTPLRKLAEVANKRLVARGRGCPSTLGDGVKIDTLRETEEAKEYKVKQLQ